MFPNHTIASDCHTVLINLMISHPQHKNSSQFTKYKKTENLWDFDIFHGAVYQTNLTTKFMKTNKWWEWIYFLEGKVHLNSHATSTMQTSGLDLQSSRQSSACEMDFSHSLPLLLPYPTPRSSGLAALCIMKGCSIWKGKSAKSPPLQKWKRFPLMKLHIGVQPNSSPITGLKLEENRKPQYWL